MRVISGSCRGRKLKSPDGTDTRPTSEKVKEAMFSIIQFELEGRRVLDLFAGSGQLGIEALSRGAAEAVFIENNRSNAEVVRKNLETCHLDDSARIVMSDSLSYLKRDEGEFDIIIIDPPYAENNLEKVLNLIVEFDRLSLNGIIIIESDLEARLDEVDGLIKGKEYFYGKTKLSLYRKTQP